ncbi:MAG: MoaD/ThiS family protein [Candidatus Thorarchaeota archaeon]|jgi:MoaD family protein
MSVVVELFGILARTAGTKEITIELTNSLTVEKLLDKLTKRFGEEFEKLLVDKESKQYVPLLLMINGKDEPWDATRKRELANGDRVTILPPIAGG